MIISQGPYIAHRGASKLAPENTMAAFRRAHALGASSSELDVGLSRDGEFLVLHDDTLERTTNGKGRLDQTSAAELQKLDAGSWHSPAFTGEPIPKLDDVLDWAKDKIHLTIEMKSATARPGTAQKLVRMLKEKEMTEQVSVISFASDLVDEVESLAPEIDTGLLLSERPTVEKLSQGLKTGLALGGIGSLIAGLTGHLHPLAGVGLTLASTVLGGLIGKAVSTAQNVSLAGKTGADALMPFWLDADKALVRAAAEHGKKVVPYTANHPALVRRLLANGVAGVITDTPERFCTPRTAR